MSPRMDTLRASTFSGAWKASGPSPLQRAWFSLGQSFYGWFTGNATGFWFSPFTGFRSLHPLQPVPRQTATVPHQEHPCPTARFGRTGDVERKNPMPLNLNHLHPSTPAKPPEKSGPSCYNANRKSSGKAPRRRHKDKCNPAAESWKQRRGTTKVATSGVARVSRRAVSPFVVTYLCSMSLQHDQPRRRRCRLSRSGGVNTHESNEIAPGMWGW